MKHLILYIVSLALGGAGAWLVARWGSGFGLLDKANHRSSHKGVVPKGGGIGILAAAGEGKWASPKAQNEAKPGITGWAQVNGRNAISWEDKFKLDVYFLLS